MVLVTLLVFAKLVSKPSFLPFDIDTSQITLELEKKICDFGV